MKKGIVAVVVIITILVVIMVALGLTVVTGVNTILPVASLKSNLTPTTDPEDVDMVYTWVDSRDKTWRAQRDALTTKRIRAQLTTHAVRWPTLTDSLSELQISLKSVRAFMPWVRKIWVVTHRPQTIDDPDVTFVHHDEILDTSNLPTFNSQSIETGLHRINGLSEHFIYMNDDVFIGKPLKKSDFYNGGKPIMRLAPKLYLWAHNSPLYKHFGKKGVGQGPSVIRMKKVMGGKIYSTDHQAAPMTISLMNSTQGRYSKDWAQTQSFAFRDDSNIAPISMSYNHGLRTNQIHTLRRDTLSSLAVGMDKFSSVRRKNPAMFCIHDVQSEASLNEVNDYVDALILKHTTV